MFRWLVALFRLSGAMSEEPRPARLMGGAVEKPWWTSKVFWFNALSFVAAALELTEVINVVPAAYQDGVTAFVALVNLGLRFVTGAPLAARRRA